MEEKIDFKHIVRIVNTDLNGKKPISVGLTKIKGVGHIFANAICTISNIEKGKQTGYLTDDEITKMEYIIKNPDTFPKWMFNRRKDPETGENIHLIGPDLKFVQSNDIKIMKKIKSYKGTRHIAGLPARGQQTKSNFRRNKGKATGVKRKKK